MRNVRLCVGTVADVHRRLGALCVFNGWADDLFFGGHPVLALTRPSKEHSRGRGGSLTHQWGGYQLATPSNTVIFKADSDPTMIHWLQRRALLFGYELVSDAKHLLLTLRRIKRPMLGIDDYGAHFEEHVINSRHTVRAVSDKARLAEFVPEEHLPVQEIISLDEPREWRAALARITDDGKHDAYLKTVDGQSDQTGVYWLSHASGSGGMLTELDSLLSGLRAQIEDVECRLREKFDTHAFFAPARNFVLQRALCGTEGKLQLFFHLDDPEEVSVIGVSNRLNGSIAGGTQQYHMPAAVALTPELRAAASAFAAKLRSSCPGVFGLVKADYFMEENGRVVLFDLGLRSSGSTSAAFACMRSTEHGHNPVVFADWRVSTQVPMLSFETAARALGELLEPEAVFGTGYGLYPFGWNHYQGNGRFALVVDVSAASDPRTEGPKLLARLAQQALSRLQAVCPAAREGL